MENRFDIYDLLTALIPGSVVLFCVYILFRDVLGNSGILDSALKIFIFVILAFIAGHILIAVKSTSLWKDLAEGRDRHPSRYVFMKGLGDSVLSKKLAQAIKNRLKYNQGLKTLSDEEAFTLAMKFSEVKPSAKLHKIYALHDFYRVMIVAVTAVFIMFFIALITGSYRSDLSIISKIPALLVSFLFYVLCFGLFRSMARSRAIYWVREVLLSADRALSSK